MRGFEELLNRINFRKAAKIYISVSILLLIICGAAFGFVNIDKIKLAIDYNNVSESFRHNGYRNDLQSKLVKLTSDSAEIINCIVVDKSNNIVYKTNDNLVNGSSKFTLTTEESNKMLLHDNINKDVAYRVASEENIILNRNYIRNHEQLISDIDQNLYFEKDLEEQNIHLLNYIVNRETKEKLFIIRSATSIPYAETLAKTIGIVIGLIFIIYWIGTALWVFKDANRRKVNPALWGGIVLITNIVGVIVYAMYKQTNKVCGRCGAVQNKDNAFCSVCGTQINERCEACNSLVSKNQKYCNSCGHKLFSDKD